MIPYRKINFRTALIVLALGVTSPLAASADECKSLWIERNQIFKNQGYCFGSALGKGYFGNSDCTTKSPSLSSSQQKRVAAIKRREGQLNCAAKKENWTVASLRNNSSGGTRSTSSSSSEPTGGGLLGAMLRGGIRAIENAGSSSGSSSGSYQLKSKYTLVCRERVLMDVDTWKKGPSATCTGDYYQCEQDFKQQIESQYGGLGKACASFFGSSYTYEQVNRTDAY